jgi:hypothetical protein
LEGDGVDAALNTTSLFNLTDKWAVSWAGEWVQFSDYTGPWRMLREAGSPISAGDNRLEEYSRWVGIGMGDRAIYSRYQTQGSNSDREGVQPLLKPFVAWANRNVGTESAVGEIYEGSTTQKTDAVLPFSVGTATLSLFKGYRGDSMDGNIYGYAFVVGGLSVEKRADLNTYMQSLAGVTL